MKNLTYYIHCRKENECVVMAQHDDGTDEASPYMSYTECSNFIKTHQLKSMIQKERQKQAIIKSLKWVVVNLAETEKNTFPHAIKAYCQDAIDFMEKS